MPAARRRRTGCSTAGSPGAAPGRRRSGAAGPRCWWTSRRRARTTCRDRPTCWRPPWPSGQVTASWWPRACPFRCRFPSPIRSRCPCPDGGTRTGPTANRPWTGSAGPDRGPPWPAPWRWPGPGPEPQLRGRLAMLRLLGGGQRGRIGAVRGAAAARLRAVPGQDRAHEVRVRGRPGQPEGDGAEPHQSHQSHRCVPQPVGPAVPVGPSAVRHRQFLGILSAGRPGGRVVRVGAGER